MSKADRQAWLVIPVAIIVAAVMGWAGSQGSIRFEGLPLFALCGGLAFLIQWLAFVPAYRAQTEHYFDLTGSLTYLALVLFAFFIAGVGDSRSLLLTGLVTVWALRLGSFLFLRVREDGSDRRFDAIKPSLPRFLMVWTLQGLWVFLTLSAALAALTTRTPVPLGWLGLLGSVVFAAGFVIEVLADRQKRAFRARPEQRGQFITTGLWAWSRHPNYFGEIVLWIGIFLIAAPVLQGWQWLTLISPLFVIFLLTRVSGIPMLEARARKRWGDDPEYQAYVARTPALVPRPPRSQRSITTGNSV